MQSKMTWWAGREKSLPGRTSTTSAIASLLSSMPPSTDCSAATSCGGCRSYSGGDGGGLLNSAGGGTPNPSIHSPAHPRTDPRQQRGPVGEAPGRDTHDSNVCSGLFYRRAPTTCGSAATREDVRKSGRTSPTPVGTLFCTTCGQVGGRTPVDMW